MVRNRSIAGLAAPGLLLGLASIAPVAANDVDPLQVPETQLEPTTFAAIEGWADDDHAAAFAAFRTSCRPFLARGAKPDPRPIWGALREVCRRAASAGPLADDKEKARTFFEENFQPVRIARLGETTGLLTGYYEPIVDGSRFPSPEFSAPLYRRPRDLVIEGRPPGTGPFPNRGKVGKYNAKKKFEPYHDRRAIEDGALDGQKLEIAWIRDAWQAMTIQIQGSARVRLEDGTMLRLNYDAHNGHSYTAVGRVLIERNLVPREEMSMERIRQWMAANPDGAKELRGNNKSFVFFRITGLDSDVEPSGAQGVPLTPWRSIAVDRIHVYGTPFFIDAQLPIEGPRTADTFRRLMVSQDTGSAIIGPARADLYFGAGNDAGRIAGRIRQQGRFVMLLPRELDMVEAGKRMPLPRARPAKLVAPAKDKVNKGKADKDKSKVQNGQPKNQPNTEGQGKEGRDKKDSAPKQPESKGRLKRSS